MLFGLRPWHCVLESILLGYIVASLPNDAVSELYRCSLDNKSVDLLTSLLKRHLQISKRYLHDTNVHTSLLISELSSMCGETAFVGLNFCFYLFGFFFFLNNHIYFSQYL